MQINGKGARESHKIVLVLLLIGWQSSKSFCQLYFVVKANKAKFINNVPFGTQVKTALTNAKNGTL